MQPFAGDELQNVIDEAGRTGNKEANEAMVRGRVPDLFFVSVSFLSDFDSLSSEGKRVSCPYEAGAGWGFYRASLTKRPAPGSRLSSTRRAAPGAHWRVVESKISSLPGPRRPTTRALVQPRLITSA